MPRAATDGPEDFTGQAMHLRRRDVVDRLYGIAPGQQAVRPDPFWHDVILVCECARQGAFHLSETLPASAGEDGPLEYAAREFLRRWDGRE